MYFVEKEGVYKHGIFWIGEDLVEAITKADDFAEADIDDYHSWVVYEFDPEQVYRNDAVHEDKYSTRKGQPRYKMVFS